MPTLATVGESLLRLTPPPADSLETASTVDAHVGGPESNVAAVAAQLGVSTTWLTKLADTPLGRRVARAVRAHGVDAAVTWSDEGRVPVRFREVGPAPRGRTTVVDREGTAMQTATAGDLPLERVRSADAVYVTSVTPALSPDVAETTVDLLERAGEAATTTVFAVAGDRSPWSAEEAGETLSEVLPLVDVLIVTEADAAAVLGYDAEPASIGAQLVAEYGHETVLIPRGKFGAVALSGGEMREQAAIEAETHDATGARDALVGGFLARRLTGGAVQEALAWGAACEAVTRTVAGDVAALSPARVNAVVAEGTDPDRPR